MTATAEIRLIIAESNGCAAGRYDHAFAELAPPVPATIDVRGLMSLSAGGAVDEPDVR